MTRSARTSDALERAARRVFKSLCGSLIVYVLFAIADVDKTHPDAYDVAKWAFRSLLGAWGLLGFGAAFTEPEGS